MQQQDSSNFRPPIVVSVALLALVALGFLLQSLGPAPLRADPGDAMVYWEASVTLQSGENNIYDTGEWESFGRPYIYPPAFAALFAPFTWFDDRPEMDPMERGLLRPYPFPTSLYVWVALIGLMWGCAVWLIARALGNGLRQRLWLAAVGSVCLWGAFYLDAKFGNVNTLILLMLAGGLVLVFKGRPWTGGLVLGAAAMIKVMPAALIVIFALQRNWKTCAAMVAGAALLWLAPLAITIPNHGVLGGLAANFEMTWEWVTRLLLPSAQTTKFAVNAPYAYSNLSVNAALHRLFGEGTQLKLMVWDQNDVGPLLFALPGPLLKATGMLVPVSMFGAAVYAAFKRRETHVQWGMAGLAFIAASAANVLFWHYHFVAFVLPVAAAVAVARTRADRWLAWVGIGSLFVLALGPNIAAAGFGSLPAVRMMVWCVPTLGFVIGWCCLWACLWRSSPPHPAIE